MTLHEAVKHFRWDATHDYTSDDRDDGQIVTLYGLSLYEADLKRLREMVPGLVVTILRRVTHDDNDWLRVDVVEVP